MTNFSINKKCKQFNKPQQYESNDICSDKCCLTALWKFLARTEGEHIVKKCKMDIESAIIRTLIAAETEVNSEVKSLTRHSNACFELFGVDLMIDKNFKIWLIEFNVAPSLMVRHIYNVIFFKCEN